MSLWLGSRNRGPMTGSGVYQMLDRRAEEAGYDPQAVHPHMFRHYADGWVMRPAVAFPLLGVAELVLRSA